jgi:hypothetical protein
MFGGMAATLGSTDDFRGKGIPTGELRMKQQIARYKRRIVNKSEEQDWSPYRQPLNRERVQRCLLSTLSTAV